MHPEIRLARQRAAPAHAVMSRDHIEAGLGWSWTAARVRRAIGERSTNVIVAAEGGAVRAFAIMKYLEDEAHLLLFAVTPARRRRGLGRALMTWLDETVRVAGIGSVQLEVRAGNLGARAFYRSLGYAEDELLRGYYRGLEAAVRMRRSLREAHAIDPRWASRTLAALRAGGRT